MVSRLKKEPFLPIFSLFGVLKKAEILVKSLFLTFKKLDFLKIFLKLFEFFLIFLKFTLIFSNFCLKF